MRRSTVRPAELAEARFISANNVGDDITKALSDELKALGVVEFPELSEKMILELFENSVLSFSNAREVLVWLRTECAKGRYEMG